MTELSTTCPPSRCSQCSCWQACSLARVVVVVMAQAAALHRLAPQHRSWRSSFNKAISKRQILMLTISLDLMSRFPVTRWSSEHRRKAVMRLE